MFCFHDRLREFKFSDGAIIKMCPDCTAFDTKRAEVLRSGYVEIPKAKEERHWAFVLEQAGLSDNEGLLPSETYVGDGTAVDKVNDIANQLRRGISKQTIMLALGDKWGKSLRLFYRLRSEPKAKPTTLDDHEWVARQRPFPHTQEMPRRFNSYCAQCTEVVLSVKRPWVVRITKGIYLPIEHKCNSVRVYNLQGNLIEVKGI